MNEIAELAFDPTNVRRLFEQDALIEEYGPSAALAEELQAFVTARTLPHKYPRWVEFMAELPKTTTGKIQRFKLRASR